MSKASFCEWSEYGPNREDVQRSTFDFGQPGKMVVDFAVDQKVLDWAREPGRREEFAQAVKNAIDVVLLDARESMSRDEYGSAPKSLSERAMVFAARKQAKANDEARDWKGLEPRSVAYYMGEEKRERAIRQHIDLFGEFDENDEDHVACINSAIMTGQSVGNSDRHCSNCTKHLFTHGFDVDFGLTYCKSCAMRYERGEFAPGYDGGYDSADCFCDWNGVLRGHHDPGCGYMKSKGK